MTETKQKSAVVDVLSKSEHTYWRVQLQPAPDHQLAPYMDRPRIFLCGEADAVKVFKDFYGIISTIHSFVVKPATDEEFEKQKETDVKYELESARDKSEVAS